VDEDARILNPEIIESIDYMGKKIDPDELKIPAETHVEVVKDYSVKCINEDKCSEIDIKFNLHESSMVANLAILLEPTGISIEKDLPELAITLDNMEVDAKIEKQEGLWAWYKIDITPGEHSSKITISPSQKKKGWTGNASFWIISFQEQKMKEISFKLKREGKLRPMPPKPWKIGEIKRNVKLGDVRVEI